MSGEKPLKNKTKAAGSPFETAVPEPVMAYIRAYNAGDVDAIGKCLAEDVSFQNISDGEVGETAVGKSEFIELAEASRALFSQRQQTIIRAITVSDTTVAEIHFTATVARDLPNGLTEGQEIEIRGRSLFRLSENKISQLIDES